MTVEKYLGSRNKNSLWLVRCVCGRRKKWTVPEIRSLYSCGCKRIELLSRTHTTHGMSYSRPYQAWANMLDRCGNPNNMGWKNYGGRGIKVCKRWRTFESFWADMGPTYREGLSLDRINNDGGYSKTNCRWTTAKVQMNNRRNSKRAS